MNKIGLFGGTFDPIHNGHLIVTEAVREAFLLDKIIFIPARQQPFKTNTPMQLPEHRLEMVKLAIASNPYFEVSDIEIRQKGISYTINTIREFRKTFPENEYELFFLLGSDNANSFHLWKQPGELLKFCKFIAFGRPGFQLAKNSSNLTSAFHLFSAPLVEISATKIRNRVRDGKSIHYLVPAAVEDYIQKHGLYLK